MIGNRLPKTPTGIIGLDEITDGGLPTGRPTLICGPAGCGKTLVALEFLVRGIAEFDEPGVFFTFEESAEDLIANVASLGFDLAELEQSGQLIIENGYVIHEPSELPEKGDRNLEGLLLRLGGAIDAAQAKRVVIDGVEMLFGAFHNAETLRSELRRLFGWLKERGVTAVITGEQGTNTLTRYGIEEYVSDCVILLDHRVVDQASTRRVRIVKYRGSQHGTNEYPFVFGESGMSVVPITSSGLRHHVSMERVSTGVPRLDAMLGDGGYYRGSAVLVSGTPGTGKSTLAATFCDAACARGEHAAYFAFEESEAEIIRNMRSVGIDLQRWVDAGLLQFHCFRPSLHGLEAHLLAMQKAVRSFEPTVVIMDPISNFLTTGTQADLSAMLTRLIDFLKSRGVTSLVTSLTALGSALSDAQMASQVDSWIHVKTMEGNGEHNRVLYVLKARGTANSNQIREFLLTTNGIELADVYVGAQGVLTGSARQAQEAKEQADGAAREDDLEQRRLDLARRRELVEAQTSALWREYEAEADVVGRLVSEGSSSVEDRAEQRAVQGRLRQADHDQVAPDPSSVETVGA
ncbi:MAG: circadian clock protein KaiC [Ilumatobacteraceae bacterium]